MTEPGNGGDIIITGGSIDLEFDPAVYVVGSDPKKRKANKKITKIQVLNERGEEQFSREDQSGLKWTIKVTGKNP